ncbi:MAG: DUF177 domain-containing protein [Hyphomicrobiales bacterium]|nr:DUF177 domain-containing protein [Hyphomicrobiales bacterium]MBV9114492.1 DUF177 domain-containing protein [Hyphomicrobiales bacterium]MBV9519454.1 DUF177 domain-containing protein [Hyphomicrobiales bacterium]
MKREFSPLRREIAIADIPRTGLEIEVEANAEERGEIARRFGLLGVEALRGSYRLSLMARGARVKGEVTARVRQTCVVSLDPFEADVREPVELTFAAEDGSRPATGRIDISPDDEDPPEPLRDGKIDLGAMTQEFLALGLDPHPRKPGVEFVREKTEVDREASPFAVLARHRGRGPAKG